MVEEEILERIKIIDDTYIGGEYLHTPDLEAVCGLLNLYNQEKEKNKKLEEVIRLMASDMERLGSVDEKIEYYFNKVKEKEE